MNIITTSKRYETDYPDITRVVIGNKTPSGAMTNRREYFEVNMNGKKLIAIDYMSALTTYFQI